ncbi:hypothetical protein OBBRIDRAFT_789472 [Obba rivulosa]|uniref:Uncharacterized protein n=1 Tax=Obba rivulosa TaxID=1052685 RepID=A0A8E2J4B0_9APHY|nr:hypothetical protein OBBRIDRAFT_789472 [Obba rivulosa]
MTCVLTDEEISTHSDTVATDGYCENPHLFLLARDSRNLVLDSVCPELVPHIVITSPEEDPWADYWASWANRVDPQDESFLTVPDREYGLGFLPTASSYDFASEVEIPGGSASDPMPLCEYLHSEPRRVFSRTVFFHKIAVASQERRAVWLISMLHALHRHQYKATVIRASLVAASFRVRWDSPEFSSAVDKPFKWSDPAETLLSEYGRYLGSTVIDSHKPCSIPHIVIQEPPPQDPWVLDMSYTPSPQDFGFGYYLTVPSSTVDYINCGADPEEEKCLGDLFDEPTPSSSTDRSDISGLETLALDESVDFEFTYEDAADPFALDPDDIITPLPSLGLETKYLFCEKFRSICLATSEASWSDEDEDLPPFDTWYQGIAKRVH